MITSFTPCFNFITGSSGNSNSPTEDCCDSFRSLMRTSVECTCLVITANVPIPLPINRTLAISLPRACNNGGVPMQCKASGSPLPPPGPVLFAPPPPSLAAPSPHIVATSPDIAPSPLSPQASKAAAAAAAAPPVLAPAPELAFPPEYDNPADTTPADAPLEPNVGNTSGTPGIRPVLNPTSSNSNPSFISAPWSLLLTLFGIFTVYKFH
ncbi:hypothetical protein CRG98_045145 [Punica granatum]|nr:hypothetical protein CRG98_045145 [Punica granatum]